MDLRQEIIRIALQTERDKQQRALNAAIRDIQEEEDLKKQANKVIQEYNQTQATPISHTRVWLWNGETSGGKALTPMGAEFGRELRFSYYNQPRSSRCPTSPLETGGQELSPQNRRKDSAEVEELHRLLDFLQEGFQNPGKIIDYLRSRKKCHSCKVIDGCEKLRTHFDHPMPWTSQILDEFRQWYAKWYSGDPENAYSAFFTYSRLAEFLETERGLSEEKIKDCLKIEFKGKGKLQNNVPPCLWKGEGGLEINKHELKINRGLACDFYLKSPFIPVVGEIKVIDKSSSNLKLFEEDLKKCELWLSDKVTTMVIKKWHLKGGFRYALAILIDLTEGQVCRPLWQEFFKGTEEDYLRKGIIPRLISACQ